MALIALAFLNVFDQLAKATWLTHEYEAALKAHPSSATEEDHGEESHGDIDILKIGNGEWWYVGLLAGAGCCVGLTKVIWTFLLFPSHPFPDKPPGLLQELSELRSHDALVSIPVICCSALSIGLGASAGPEAALGAVGTSLGSGLVARRWDHIRQWFRKCFPNKEEDDASERVPSVRDTLVPYLFPDLSEEEELCALDGMAGGFGALFPSQMLAVMLIHELGFLFESKKDIGHFMETVIRTGIAASVGYALFVGLEDKTFLEQVVLPQAAYDLLPEIKVVHMLDATILGIISGCLGLVGFLMLGIFGGIGTKVSALLDGLNSKFCLPDRFLGLLLTPVIGGIFVGLLCVAAPLCLSDGAEQIGSVVALGHDLGAGNLIVTMFCKLGTVSISLGFGFVGGQIFPLLFAGTCLGAIANIWVPEVPVLVAVPSCMVAVPCAFMPAIMTLTTIASMTLALGGAATTPVFLASIVSYTTVCGLGLVQDVVAKAVGDTPEVTASEQAKKPEHSIKDMETTEAKNGNDIEEPKPSKDMDAAEEQSVHEIEETKPDQSIKDMEAAEAKSPNDVEEPEHGIEDIESTKEQSVDNERKEVQKSQIDAKPEEVQKSQRDNMAGEVQKSQRDLEQADDGGVRAPSA